MLSPSGYFNDGSSAAPRLSVYLNLQTLIDLRADTLWAGPEGLLCYQKLQADGFQGVKLSATDLPQDRFPLPYCGLDRMNTPADADPIGASHAVRGDQCITVHADWGLGDEDEVFRLVEASLLASVKHRLPALIETHRATITQDLCLLSTAVAGDVLIFAPELLSGAHYYARLFPDTSGQLVEESDRYRQALIYKDLVCACFAEAERGA
jgi:hypothetical protein